MHTIPTKPRKRNILNGCINEHAREEQENLPDVEPLKSDKILQHLNRKRKSRPADCHCPEVYILPADSVAVARAHAQRKIEEFQKENATMARAAKSSNMSNCSLSVSVPP